MVPGTDFKAFDGFGQILCISNCVSEHSLNVSTLKNGNDGSRNNLLVLITATLCTLIPSVAAFLGLRVLSRKSPTARAALIKILPTNCLPAPESSLPAGELQNNAVISNTVTFCVPRQLRCCWRYKDRKSSSKAFLRPIAFSESTSSALFGEEKSGVEGKGKANEAIFTTKLYPASEILDDFDSEKTNHNEIHIKAKPFWTASAQFTKPQILDDMIDIPFNRNRLGSVTSTGRKSSNMINGFGDGRSVGLGGSAWTGREQRQRTLDASQAHFQNGLFTEAKRQALNIGLEKGFLQSRPLPSPSDAALSATSLLEKRHDSITAVQPPLPTQPRAMREENSWAFAHTIPPLPSRKRRSGIQDIGAATAQNAKLMFIHSEQGTVTEAAAAEEPVFVAGNGSKSAFLGAARPSPLHSPTITSTPLEGLLSSRRVSLNGNNHFGEINESQSPRKQRSFREILHRQAAAAAYKYDISQNLVAEQLYASVSYGQHQPKPVSCDQKSDNNSRTQKTLYASLPVGYKL